jgi:glycosyltransferase involved in cell wall biosynthesis
MNLVCFSWEFWDPRVNKRSVPLVLALLRNKLVDRALYVNPPVRLSAIVRRYDVSKTKERLRYFWPRRHEKVIVFTPCYLLPVRFGKANGFLGRLQLGLLKRILRLRPYIYLNTNPMSSELQKAFADADFTCLDMYDDFEQIVSEDEIRRGEATRIRDAVNADARRADLVVAVNSLLAERFVKMGVRTGVLRNAVDYTVFARVREQGSPRPPALNALPRPIMGYMTGQVDSRIDWELVEFLSNQRPGWSLVVLGPTFDLSGIPAALRSASNVHFLPAVSYGELPGFLVQFSVGMVPMRVNPVSLGNDLLKIYHYLAAGLPVVTTAVGGTDRFGALVRVAASPDEFLEQLELALRDTAPEAVERRREYARTNSWDTRAEEFALLLESCLSKRR